jgi:hypothetical protein
MVSSVDGLAGAAAVGSSGAAAASQSCVGVGNRRLEASRRGSNPYPLNVCYAALWQKRTLRTLLGASETIVVFSSTGAAGGVEILLVSSKDAIGGSYKLDSRLSASIQCLFA